MHKFATAAGAAAIAFGFLAAHAVHLRAEGMRKPVVATSSMVIAAIDTTRMTEVAPAETGDASDALASDYSWQRWPSVTDF